MCGRYTISLTKEEVFEYLYQQFGIEECNFDYPLPRYNIAPSQMVIAIISDKGNYRAGLLTWGFVPHFQKEDNAFQIINAKAETISKKDSFKEALRSRRCLILADGYYEWQKQGIEKLPYRIVGKEGKLFTFAGIWNTRLTKDGKLSSCAIITNQALAPMNKIHDRIPVILNQEAAKLWLDYKLSDPKVLSSLLNQSFDLQYYRVSKLVNNPKNDNSECIKPQN